MYMNKETFKLYLVHSKDLVKEECVEIDDMIAPTVAILNRKGYYTVYSCSSHYPIDKHNMYIAFKDFYDFPVPIGFYIEPKISPTFSGTVIRRNRVKSGEGFLKTLEAIASLYTWTTKLTFNPNIIEDKTGFFVKSFERDLINWRESFRESVAYHKFLIGRGEDIIASDTYHHVERAYEKGYISKEQYKYYVREFTNAFNRVMGEVTRILDIEKSVKVTKSLNQF